MKIKISHALLFFACLYTGNTYSQSIQYNIRPLTQIHSSCLSVQLKSQIHSSGKSGLQIPFGAKEIKTYALKDVSFKQDLDNPKLVMISGPAGSEFAIDYQLCLSNPSKLIDWPIIEEEFIVFVTNTVLAMPEDKDNERWQINVNLEEFPAEFSFMSSFAGNERKLSFDNKISEFKNSLIMGGSNLFMNKIGVNGKPIFVYKQGQTIEADSSLDKYFEKIIKTQRDFWGDNDFPHYFMLLQENACQGISAHLIGRHYENAMVVQFPICEKKEFFSKQAKWILSHELFHAWMGFKIKFDIEDSNALLWFSEGFTDYYGLLLALKSGSISYAEYIEQYNDLIRYYFQNPMNLVSNEEIIKNIEGNIDYRIVYQLRGHLLAKEISSQLAKKGLSLEALMKEIYAEYKKIQVPLGQSSIYRIFRKYLDDQQWQSFIQHIEEGSPFIFPEKGLGVFSKKVYKKVAVPSMGFDLPTLIKTKTIQNLEKNSPAYRAGLREGQKISVHNPTFIDTEKEVYLWVEGDEGAPQEIHFTPEKIEKVFPQYVKADFTS